MEDIDGGLHPAVDGQSLDEGEDDAAAAAASSTAAVVVVVVVVVVVAENITVAGGFGLSECYKLE